MKRVLVIEDDKNIIDLLEIHLLDLNCEITRAYDGAVGFGMAQQNDYDLIILDIMLPGMNGIDVCRELRIKQVQTPILMLTAKSEEIDKVIALEGGADDYITKPFGIREFIARVKAIFRRAKIVQDQQTTNSVLKFDNLGIDLEKRKVTLQDSRINLSPKEFELLVLLASNPGRSYQRRQILNLVWGYDFDGYEHTVNAHINRLRNKIEPDVAEPKYILTTWGIGYRFNEDL